MTTNRRYRGITIFGIHWWIRQRSVNLFQALCHLILHHDENCIQLTSITTTPSPSAIPSIHSRGLPRSSVPTTVIAPTLFDNLHNTTRTSTVCTPALTPTNLQSSSKLSGHNRVINDDFGDLPDDSGPGSDDSHSNPLFCGCGWLSWRCPRHCHLYTTFCALYAFMFTIGPPLSHVPLWIFGCFFEPRLPSPRRVFFPPKRVGSCAETTFP